MAKRKKLIPVEAYVASQSNQPAKIVNVIEQGGKINLYYRFIELAMGFCELSRIVDVEAIVRLAEPKAQPAVLNEASKKKSWPLRLVWKLDRFSSE